MKKILTILLSLCLLVSLATCLATVSTGAEEKDVTVGQVFEWNDQSKEATGDDATEIAWRTGKATSPDGNWKYCFYALEKKVYRPVVIASGNLYAWNKNPGSDDNGLGYARVREFGKNFHPAEKADIVKTFICPSGGSISISTTVVRENSLESGTARTGTSFAIYKENNQERTLIYPEAGAGEYLTLVSTTPQTVEVTVDVAKGERIHIHIGAMVDQGSDAVNMENTITYKSISDAAVSGPVTDGTVGNTSSFGREYTDPVLGDKNQGNGDSNAQGNGGGLSTGAIVGIVIGAVAVVGIAVVVVVILKKKKQN